MVIIDPLFVRCVNAESCVWSTPSHACEGGDAISGESRANLGQFHGASRAISCDLGQSRGASRGASRAISANLGASRLHVSAVNRAHSRGGVIADEVNAELVKVDALSMD